MGKRNDLVILNKNIIKRTILRSYNLLESLPFRIIPVARSTLVSFMSFCSSKNFLKLYEQTKIH